MEVADLYVVLRGMTGEFNRSMDEAGMASERADSKIGSVAAASSKMALGFGVAAVGIAAESVKLASAFDAAMEQIHTLAGVPQQALAGLSRGVLSLAGQVGFDPHSLADALYHVESSFASTGITGARAMDILKVAAEGAKIGGADLVDVTNALDAAIASGIPGVKDYHQAMGALLSIVGSGDMQMQDLANAFSTGILAIGKQYGATLNDVGAALATFGDNNIRGQVAATDLRMAIMDLTKQAGPGQHALEGIGVKVGELGEKMQKGGMNAALIDLRNHLNAAGITGTKVGRFLEDAFTKKSSAPLAVLLGEFDRLESKYPELAKGAHGFDSAWKATAEQFKTRMAQMKAQGEAWLIQLGNLLIPVLTKLMGKLMDIVHWFGEHKKAAQELGVVVKGFLVGALVLAGVALAAVGIEAALVAAPFILASLAIGALAKWLMNLYEHNAKFHAFVDQIAADVKRYFGEAVAWVQTNGPKIWATIQEMFGRARRFTVTAFTDIRNVIRTVLAAVNGWLDDHRGQINKIFGDIGKTLRSVADIFGSAYDLVVSATTVALHIIEDIWGRFGGHVLPHVITALKVLWDTFKGVFIGILQVVRGAFEILKGIFDVFDGIFTGDWHKFLNGLSEIFGGAWNVIAGAFRVVWNLLVGILREGINLLSAALGLGVATISAIWGLGWHAMETMFRALWHRVAELTRQSWDQITGFFSAGWRRARDLTVDGFEQIGGWFANLWRRAAKLTSDGVGQILGFFHHIYTDARNILSDAGSWLLDIGKAIMEGLLQGIKNGWNDVSGFLGSVADKVKNLKGPIEFDRQLLVPHGNAIMDGLNEGLLTGFGRVQTNLAGMAGHMSGKFAANLGVNVSQFGAGSASSAVGNGGLGTGQLSTGGQQAGNLTVIVQGSVLTERDLLNVIEEGFLNLGQFRGGARTYQPFHK